MKVLITSPTGNVGRRIVPELLAPEFSVRVIARDPARLPAEMLGQVEVIRGSTDDAALLREALDGVDALFWCIPTESLQETNVERHYERFACAGWQAIRQAGTPRVVTLSAAGKGHARRAGPFSGLYAMEEILNDSGAAIRHVRCGLFMENLLPQARAIQEHGLISYPMPGHLPIPMTSISDVADVALRWLVRRDWEGIEGISVHGPEDLSLNQAAAILEQILERPVRYQEEPASNFLRALVENGASAEYARSRVDMFSALTEGVMRAEPRTTESTTSTTLAAWAQIELLPAIAAHRLQLRKTGAASQNLNKLILADGHFERSRKQYEHGTQKASPA